MTRIPHPLASQPPESVRPNRWQGLAVLLGVIWVGVLIVRTPTGNEDRAAEGSADPDADAGGVTESASADPEHELRRAILEEPESALQDSIALMLRAVGPDGLTLNASVRARLADGTAAEVIRAGSYQLLPAVPFGRLQLKWFASAHYDRTEELEIPRSPPEQQHEVMLEPSARIEVRFMTPNGDRLLKTLREHEGFLDPHLGIPSIYTTEGGLLPELPLIRSDAYRSPYASWAGQGLMQNEDRPDGYLSLRIRPPLLLHAMLRNRVLATQALEGPVETLEFVIDPERILAEMASLRVRILDGATGEPIGKAGVYLDGGGRASVGLRRLEDGFFERDGIPPGIYELQARQGHLFFNRSVTLRSGEHVDLGEIRLAARSPFQCRIYDPAGEPVAKAQLLLHAVAPDPRSSARAPFEAIWSNDEGITEHPAIPTGEYLITVVPPDGSQLAPTWLRVVHPGAATESVRLERGRSLVLTPTDEDAFQHQVNILVNGVAPTSGLAYSALPVRLTLAPGQHAWVLSDAGGAELRRGEFEVAADGPEPRIEVPLP